jgi:hypothetical protein
MKTKLTKKEESKIPVYLKKWQEYGYRTKKTDRYLAKKAVNFLYEKIMKLERPEFIIFLDSPMACELACNLIKGTKLDGSQLDSQLDSQLYSQLHSQLYSQLHSQLGSRLYSQLYSQLDSQLHSQLDSQLYSQLHSQLYSQLHSQLGSRLYSQLDSQLYSQLHSQLRSQLRSQLSSQLYSQLYSQKLEYFYLGYSLWFYAGYYGFYDYVLNELFPKKKKDFKLFTEFTSLYKELHQFFLFPKIAFVSEFPSEINVSSDFRLHNFNGPALLYPDSYSIYKMNGVTVTKEQTETSSDKFTKEMILGEKNADVRRELVRKIGIEKAMEILEAKVIDKDMGYELLTLDLGDKRNRPYLKMKDFSIKAYHIEGVHPDVKTVKEALCYRNGLKEFAAPIAAT